MRPAIRASVLIRGRLMNASPEPKMLRLDDVPGEIIYAIVEYLSASDIAILRLVNGRLKVFSAKNVNLTKRM